MFYDIQIVFFNIENIINDLINDLLLQNFFFIEGNLFW